MKDKDNFKIVGEKLFYKIIWKMINDNNKDDTIYKFLIIKQPFTQILLYSSSSSSYPSSLKYKGSLFFG